jgi:ATP-binding cassette subfamily B protein
MRSLMKDSSVRHHKLSAGTLRRILGFARPYRGYLAFFLVLVAFDAGTGAVTPLLFRAIIDKGIVPGHAQVVVWLALVSSTTSVPLSSTTCSSCPSPSSAGRRPAP